MFENLVKPNKLTTSDADFRQPFDPTNYPVFKRYESGYGLFLVLEIPNMLTLLSSTKKGEVTGIEYSRLYSNLIASYVRTLEREFKRLDGLDNITSESIEFNGMNEVSVNSINSVQESYNGAITLTYTETHGEVFTKVHELFLKGIDDPVIGHRKHYNGLIDDKILAPSFKNEVFSFLFIVTDNTGLQLERAYYFFNAQPTTSHTGELYGNFQRGNYEEKELSIEFKCNILSNEAVFKQAKKILNAITGYEYDAETDKVVPVSKPVFEQDSNKFKYQGLVNKDKRIGGMNYSGEDISKISALNKIFDIDYASINNSNEDFTITSNTLKTITLKTYTPEARDISREELIKQYIDKPIVGCNDVIYIKPNSDLASCIGHKSTPRLTTFNGNPSPVCTIKSYFSEESAQLWADEHKYYVIYGPSSRLYPYCVSLNGITYYLKAGSFYVNKQGIWIDPITGLEVDVKTENTKMNEALYKSGDKVMISNSAGVQAYKATTGNTTVGSLTDSSKVFTIKSVASTAEATKIMSTYGTNYPYAHPNFHPYQIEFDSGSKTMAGYFNEEDLKPAEETKTPEKTEEEVDAALINKLAWECIRGNWGNGTVRVDKLTKAGYDFRKVQDEVNRILYG